MTPTESRLARAEREAFEDLDDLIADVGEMRAEIRALRAERDRLRAFRDYVLDVGNDMSYSAEAVVHKVLGAARALTPDSDPRTQEEES